MSSFASQPLEFATDGFRIMIEARLMRAATFSGVFHVLSDSSHPVLTPPVVVLIPGKYAKESDALRAARDYAAIMAGDGSLRELVALRLSIVDHSSQ